MARLAHQTFLVRAGKEKSVAATKTYTGQLACFYLLAYALGADLQQAQLRRIPDWTAAALRTEEEVAAKAERFCLMQHAICIGRGLNYSNSFEFALKLMETCYVVAERFSSADLLHGPIAMVEASFPAFLFGPIGVTWPATKQLLQKLQAIGAQTLVITDVSNIALPMTGTTQRTVIIPATLNCNDSKLPEDIWTPIPYIIPGQLFAASLAEIRGLNPDQPRTLSKVTQTI